MTTWYSDDFYILEPVSRLTALKRSKTVAQGNNSLVLTLHTCKDGRFQTPERASFSLWDHWGSYWVILWSAERFPANVSPSLSRSENVVRDAPIYASTVSLMYIIPRKLPNMNFSLSASTTAPMEQPSLMGQLRHSAIVESAMSVSSTQALMSQANNFSAYHWRIREAHGSIGKWRSGPGYVVRGLFSIISVLFK